MTHPQTLQPALGEFAARIGGRPVAAGPVCEVRNPFDGSVVALVRRADRDALERAVALAEDAFGTTRRLPSWKRGAILEHVSAAIATDREDLARTIALEAGKPIRSARAEVDRAAFVFKVAAEEAKRIGGETIALDWIPGAEGRVAHVRRVPLGPVLGITPFNFPLLLVSHKIAPAIAAGNPIVLRPASQTPVSALKLAGLVLDAGWPENALAVVPSTIEAADVLVRDDRIKLLTFTGSPPVGWSLKARAGRKRVALELGGNAAVIIHADADVAYAAERVTFGGFSYAGQSCISVQRVYVHDAVYDALVGELVPRVKALKVGDPLDETTDVGPLIDRAAAERVEEWMAEAVAGGAEVLTGGRRAGAVWQPTVLASVSETMRVSCQEVFAPLVSLARYSDAREAIRAVDCSDYGLQAGIFTNDLALVDAAVDGIEVGGLIVNDVPTFRVDHMPYGGTKQSGLGREGLRYAIEEMTEMKLVAFNRRMTS